MSSYGLNLYVLVFTYIVAIGFAAAFIGSCIEYRKQRIVQGYMAVIGLYIGWLVANLFFLLPPDLEHKLQFISARFIFISLIPPSWVYFVRELFKKPHQKPTSRWIWLIYIVPLCVSVASQIPSLRPWLVRDVQPFLAFGIPTLRWKAGPLLTLHLIYCYLCLIVCAYYCVKGLQQDRRIKSQYGVLLLFALTLFTVVEYLGMFVIPELRFLGVPALSQIFSPMAFYYILHRQQIVRAFSHSSNILFESLPTPVILTDCDDQVILYNSRARDLFLFEIGTAGHGVSEVLPVEVSRGLPPLGVTEKGKIVEMHSGGADAETRYFEVSSESFGKDSPLGGGRLLVFNEVTELKRSTQANQRLMSLMSHDLLGNLSSLEMLSRNRSEIHWELIADTSKSAADLLKNLLLWSSTQGNFYQPHREQLAANQLIVDCVKPFLPVAESKQVHLKVMDSDPDLYMNVDRKMFAAILRNILSNAIKFSPAHSRIEIECCRRGGEIYLRIADQGPGMDQAVIKRILSYRENKPVMHSSSSDGYGIGIYIILHFLKLHEGRLEIASRDEGGCEVTAIFPV